MDECKTSNSSALAMELLQSGTKPSVSISSDQGVIKPSKYSVVLLYDVVNLLQIPHNIHPVTCL